MLFGVGALAGTLLWLGLGWIPRRVAPAQALRAFGAARGAFVRGDGRVDPLTVVGEVRGRPFTVTWQRPAGGGDVLLVGVDCAADVAEPLAPVAPAVAGGDAPLTAAADAALVTRWVRPPLELFVAARIDAIVESMARLAEELEATHPETPDPD
ncbi:MAG: hypothetical protein ACK4YP_01675 [Myxococcota bacterium]